VGGDGGEVMYTQITMNETPTPKPESTESESIKSREKSISKLRDRLRNLAQAFSLVLALASPPLIIRAGSQELTPPDFLKITSHQPDVNGKEDQIAKPANTSESKESVQEKQTLLIDFFGNLDRELNILTSNEFGEENSYAKLTQKLDIADAVEAVDLRGIMPSNKAEAAALMLKSLQLHYGNHGEQVEKVLQQAGADFGVQSSYVRSDMSQAIDGLSIEETDLGYRLVLHVSPEEVIKIIRGSDADIVSMSMIVEDFTADLIIRQYAGKYPDLPLVQTRSVTVEGIEQTTFYIEEINNGEIKRKNITPEEAAEIEAKSKEVVAVDMDPSDYQIIELGDYKDPDTAYSNLKALNRVVSETGKIIVAAAGNPHEGKIPDLRKAKRKLQDEEGMSPALFTVGVEGPIYEHMHDVYALGADFYIKREDIEKKGEVNPGSSYATPIVEQMISKIISKGITDPTHIRAELAKVSLKIRIPSAEEPPQGSMSRLFIDDLELKLEESGQFHEDMLRLVLKEIASYSDEEMQNLLSGSGNIDNKDEMAKFITNYISENQTVFCPDPDTAAQNMKRLVQESIELVSHEAYIIDLSKIEQSWILPDSKYKDTRLDLSKIELSWLPGSGNLEK